MLIYVWDINLISFIYLARLFISIVFSGRALTIVTGDSSLARMNVQIGEEAERPVNSRPMNTVMKDLFLQERDEALLSAA